MCHQQWMITSTTFKYVGSATILAILTHDMLKKKMVI